MYETFRDGGLGVIVIEFANFMSEVVTNLEGYLNSDDDELYTEFDLLLFISSEIRSSSFRYFSK